LKKWALEIASAESSGMDQTAAKNLQAPSGGSKRSAQLRVFFINWRCGPIWTRFGAYESQDPKLFGVVVPFFVGLISAFMFSVRKQKNIF